MHDGSEMVADRHVIRFPCGRHEVGAVDMIAEQLGDRFVFVLLTFFRLNDIALQKHLI